MKKINIGKSIINCPYDFDLINKEIFDKIINKEDNISEDEYKAKYFINKETIILNIKNKEEEKCLQFLLIGKYNEAKNEFDFKGLLSFSNRDILKKHFKKLISMDFSEYKKNYIKPDNIIFDKKDEIGNYYEIDNSFKIIKNEQKKKSLNKNMKIIEFLIRLYMYYDEFKKIIDQSSKKKEKIYYLINRNWLDKYKIFYKFEKIVNLINDKKIISFFEAYKEDINEINLNELINSFPKEFKIEFEKLDFKNIDEIFKNSKPYKVKYSLNNDYIEKKFNNQIKKEIEYYKDFELFSDVIFNLFLSTLKEDNISERDNYIMRTCIFNEQRIIIPLKETNNYLLNICYFENNIVITEQIIFFKESNNLNQEISYYIDFNEYISSDIIGCNKNNNLLEIYLQDIKDSNSNQNESPTKNKIQTLNEAQISNIKDSDFYNLVLTYTNFEVIQNKILSDIKKNYKEIISNEYYLINYNILIENININKLKKIFEENKELQTIINDENIKINEKTNKIMLIINENLKKDIEKCKKQTFNFEKINELDSNYIKSGNNLIKYYQNFIPLNKKAIKLFNNKNINNNKYTCIFGDKKVFLIFKNKYQNTIEVYNFNDKTLNIELILNFKEDHDPLREFKEIIKSGFTDYKNFNVIDINNSVSQIFLDKEITLGYAYKYDREIKDYSLYHINPNLKGMMSLYYFNEYLKSLSKYNGIHKCNYYLLNTEYIEEYEKIYQYNFLQNKFKKNKNIKEFIENKIRKNEFNGTLTEKQITIFILSSSIQKINEELNKKDFEKVFKQDEPNLLELKFKQGQNVESLFYYDKLRIINKKIYISLFIEDNNQKNNYAKCFFIERIVIIKLSEYLNEIKYIYELGEFDENNIFEPKYILIYNSKEDFYTHLNYFKSNIKKLLLADLKFSENNNSLSLNINGKKIGLIIDISIKIDYMKKIPYKPIINIQKKNKNLKEDFNNPPLIGLQNVGATCYMNATLQCFCQIEKLVSFFKYNSQIKEIIEKYKNNSEDCLTISFKNLVENLWPSIEEYTNNKNNHQNSNNKYFAPYEFKLKISKMNPLFEGAQANDSKDLVNFIIMTLHQELNKSKENINSKLSNINIDQTNMESVFQYFAKNFTQENQSIVSDIFYGVSGTSTQCLNCHLIKYNFQTYFFLIFPLEEVRKMKINNIKNQLMINPLYLMNFQYNIGNINSVNIYDCFEYNQKLEFFTGENSMYCNKCNNKLPASYNTNLFTIPEILIIVLNRGKGIEFKVKLEFSEELNLINYVYFQQTGFMFKLIGVVTHLGESDASGNFIAYSKSPIDDKWYKYNDDLVTKVINFKEEIIDYAMPYILFFQKSN